MSPQQDPSPAGAPVRVEGLMRDIEDAVRRDRRRRLLGRGASPAYADAELFAAVESLLRRTIGDRAEGSLLLPDLLDDPEDWLLNTRPPAITSHRPGIGPLIVWLKRRVAMPVTRWLYDYVADNVRRQHRINRLLMTCVEELAIENARLRRDLERRSAGGSHS
ncbi:MAG TPA: hypothetical protein VEU08_10910 [Vicinamibacterales bacterium]|nr:hypothetical protein [Vicinamibacterales bacterium]